MFCLNGKRNGENLFGEKLERQRLGLENKEDEKVEWEEVAKAIGWKWSWVN